MDNPSSVDTGQPKPAGKVTQINHSGELLVSDLISARAQHAPRAVALVSSSQSLTYGDLEVRANQLAHHLRSLGVGPEVLVGVCLDRSPDMVTAALAVLKAGGAYVPLDPSYPAERLNFMLQDAGIPVLIASQKDGDRIGNGAWRVLDVEEEAEEIARNPKVVPEKSVSRQNLAYVIYTSGSTGRPKGVQISHFNLLNLISWHQRAFAISSDDRVSQLASVGFDAVVWEVWPHLVAGSSLHFPAEEVRVDAEFLRDWLVAERITVSFVPTPIAGSLLALAWPSETVLRLLLTGGDTLHHYPPSNLPFTVVNNYGPTECTVVASSGPVLPNPAHDEAPGIGRPIDNSEIYILDEHLQPVPSGDVGELFIAGRGVARGYLNRPELDAERFVANPFSKTRNERMYRTGDQGRFMPDGQISFAGRVDDQIKIRGYRIEPEEIGTLLDRYPGIQESIVVARADSGDKR